MRSIRSAQTLVRFRLSFFSGSGPSRVPTTRGRVIDDQGQCLTVPQLRDRMRAGHEPHIPTRTVGEAVQIRTTSDTHSAYNEETS